MLPITATLPESGHAKIYTEIASQVWKALEQGGLSRPAPRIVLES